LTLSNLLATARVLENFLIWIALPRPCFILPILLVTGSRNYHV
jgi:hypothetical protein